MKAVIYARYSSHSQSEQSIEGQLRECYEFAEREGYVVVHEYIDRAITGRYDDRPDFKRMISDAAKKQFQIVIVWKLDRFSRSRYDSATYKSRLKKHGVRVISAKENITDTPEGIILEGLLESMAEYYSANLSQNIKRGMQESIKKGTYLGTPPPIGFKVVNKKLVADERTAPIIRRAFEQYAAGISKKQIIEELTAQGIRRPRSGKPLTLSSFQEAFRNEKYIGIYRFGGDVVAGGCEAIIDKELFDKVQQRLDQNRKAPAAAKARESYLLQGKAFCGMCGARLVGDSGRSRNGTVHSYYACGNRKIQHTCKKKNEKKGFLEWYVVEQTVEYVLTPERIDFIADRVAAEFEREFNSGKIKEHEQQIDRVERDLNAAIDASLEAPKNARQRYYETVERLVLQKQTLEVELADMKLASNVRYTANEIKAMLKVFCNGDALDEEYQRRIIETFVNSVYVYDNKIIIFYNIKGGQQVCYIEMLDSLDEPGNDEDVPEGTGVRISNGKLHHVGANYAPLIIPSRFAIGDFSSRSIGSSFSAKRPGPGS